MTHDKVRQDFEAWAKFEFLSIERFGETYKDVGTHYAWKAYQAGRAAERTEIRKKLEGEGVVETVATALINGLRFHKGCTTAVTGTHAMLDDDAESYKAEAKAAITKILEVI